MMLVALARKTPKFSSKKENFRPQKPPRENHQLKKVPQPNVEDLIHSFKKLIVNDENFSGGEKLKKKVSQLVPAKQRQKFLSLGLFHTHQVVTKLSFKSEPINYTNIIQKRFFSSQIWDWHLNEKGLIREEILMQRRVFLIKHNLLQNEINYLGRQVYANYHLYSIDPKETIGLININRMQEGKSPLDKEGKKTMVIHHFDQTHEGPWVILPESFHQKYDLDLHTNITLIKGVIRTRFNHERAAYWKFEVKKTEPLTQNKMGSRLTA